MKRARKLVPLRRRIVAIDAKLLRLIAKRLALGCLIGEIKLAAAQATNSPLLIRNVQLEEAKLCWAEGFAESIGLSPKVAQRFLATVMRETRNAEVAYIRSKRRRLR